MGQGLRETGASRCRRIPDPLLDASSLPNDNDLGDICSPTISPFRCQCSRLQPGVLAIAHATASSLPVVGDQPHSDVIEVYKKAAGPILSLLALPAAIVD